MILLAQGLNILWLYSQGPQNEPTLFSNAMVNTIEKIFGIQLKKSTNMHEEVRFFSSNRVDMHDRKSTNATYVLSCAV